ncbi:hypothetical protein [uncultured Amnibacterium sp.]|uniref:hypothetical protein n=1 Tax=uncultured Amnibacterium sp. TaxID=1631851 RepID=UPI0035CB8CE2
MADGHEATPVEGAIREDAGAKELYHDCKWYPYRRVSWMAQIKIDGSWIPYGTVPVVPSTSDSMEEVARLLQPGDIIRVNRHRGTL